ncbi:glyceraldehyde-3-phosphate dehydrogenase (NADP+) [Gracilibacillus orientalis]|uniref:3-sulfolactaldehyde dehydrogenase n=1 Tax=Gracilibacillus orientalis TaxID=334253 RepID=A0A1I4LVK3_9BACI|nr:aldehyde dehydrogenase family protein [Gracilibacillus orientalis]SFL95218.1 glyceraldehyde-3-phosphate dehydrogenase (NADP+) [Gracilibacillus orientalis]
MQLQVKQEKMLIAGQWIAAEQTFDVFDPQDNRLIAKVPLATENDMLMAIEKADEAYLNNKYWPTYARMAVLQRVASYIEENKERYAETIALEGSKTIQEARGEVKRAIQTIKISAEEARRINGETINFDQSESGENRVGYYYRFPVGVIGAITPFNDPLNLVAHKVGPAIASGNAVIVKPASDTPLSALLLAEAFTKSGLPAGMLSVVTGSGRDVGDVLVTHPSITMITFTGGVDVGKKIAHKAGIKKVGMELGSNSPVIVLKDADVEKAVASCVSGAFTVAGQNCIGVQRVYVEKEVYDQFLELYKHRTSELHLGDKMDPLTDIGPMINEREAKRVEAWVNQAVVEGAKIQIGGKKERAFYYPTILTDVPSNAVIAQEEIFGPVVLVYSVEDVHQAIDQSNAVDYGLQAGIFTKDLENAFLTIQELEVGGIMVNDSSDYRIDAMPFGGVKQSGLGREGIKSSIEAMTELKVVSFKLN